MKIQIASDLHLEFSENRKWIEENPIIPKGDVLILAGDIVVNKYKQKAESFYKYIEKNFKHIISIQGNHEFYKGEVYFAYPSYYKQLNENHIMLNNKSAIFEGVKFICSVLWSNIPDNSALFIEGGMNDYKLIYYEDGFEKIPINTNITNDFNKLSLKFIEEELEKKFNGKIVVVTHHIPSYKCINDKNKDSEFNPAFANNLDELIKKNPKISLWIHGHSHSFSDKIIGKTRIVSNPLGYVFDNEQEGFKRDFVIEI